MHLFTPQIDIAIPQAQFVRIMFLPGNLKRQHSGGGLHNQFTRAQFNITRGKVRVAGGFITQHHVTGYGYHAFHAQVLGGFHNGRTGGNNNLC